MKMTVNYFLDSWKKTQLNHLQQFRQNYYSFILVIYLKLNTTFYENI